MDYGTSYTCIFLNSLKGKWEFGNDTQEPSGIFLELLSGFGAPSLFYLLQQDLKAVFCFLGEVEFIIRHYGN